MVVSSFTGPFFSVRAQPSQSDPENEPEEQTEAGETDRYTPGGGPVLPGLRRTSPETAGELLLGQLQCTSCHSVSEQAEHQLMPREAPTLDQIGARVSPGYLRSFLQQPHKTKPGTPMPNLLHALPKQEKRKNVNVLTHFLVSRGGPINRKKRDVDADDVRRGKQLYHQTGCVSCHQPFAPASQFRPGTNLGPSSVPDDLNNSIPLGNVREKTTLDRLTTFLKDPLKTHPSGRMPDLKLSSLEARQIATYLYTKDQISLADREPRKGLRYRYYHGKWSELPDFASMSPVKEGFTESIQLGMKKRDHHFAIQFSGTLIVSESGTHRFYTSSDDGTLLWIDGEKVVDNNGVHGPEEKSGTIKLEPGPHMFRLGYFQGPGGTELKAFWKGPSTAQEKQSLSSATLKSSGVVSVSPSENSESTFKLDTERVQKGKKQFSLLGCAECHRSLDAGETEVTAPDLASLDPDAAGCLSEEVPEGLPDYRLTGNQRQLLRDTLRAFEESAPSADNVVHRTMAAYNCYACHERNGTGGPEPARQSYFTTSEHGDIGSEARFPPDLDTAGAKLSDEGLKKILIEGEGVRPYMSTRMPRFGKDNVGHLLNALPESDRGQFKPVDVKPTADLIKDGRTLVGNDGLGCISCHRWEGYPSTGMSALDIGTAPERLRPEWFFAYLKNPQSLRPGTRMPGFWNGAGNPAPEIQNGNTRRQIAAIWSFLSQGEDAGLPDGIQPKKTDEYKLVPAHEPIVYRSFLNGVGTHSIAVGFPEKTHVSFDALGVRLARAWQGEFMSARADWHARGKNYNKIPGRNVISFPPAPAFAKLEQPDRPWPEYDPGTKQEPEHVQFTGYRYTSDRTPIFEYRYRSLTVSEKAEARLAVDRAHLRRSLRITSPDLVDNVWFRAFVSSDMEQTSNNTYRTGSGVEITFISSSDVSPKLRDAGEKTELLVPVELEKTDRNTFSLKFDIDMRW